MTHARVEGLIDVLLINCEAIANINLNLTITVNLYRRRSLRFGLRKYAKHVKRIPQTETQDVVDFTAKAKG